MSCTFIKSGKEISTDDLNNDVSERKRLKIEEEKQLLKTREIIEAIPFKPIPSLYCWVNNFLNVLLGMEKGDKNPL